MKQVILIWSFLLTTLLCFGQKERLELAKYGGFLEQWNKEINENLFAWRKEYYGNLFPLLYSGFSQKPYARFTCIPSFDAEYAFSVEKIDGKNYIISNILSESCWGAQNYKSMDSIKLNTIKIEINDELYLKIGELFELLAQQTKNPNPNKVPGVDGEDYYFTTTDKNGEIKTGKTWSPHDNSLLGKLIDICNKLHSTGSGDSISQPKMLKEIDKLINDLTKTYNKLKT